MAKWSNGWMVKLLLFLYFSISLFLLAQFKTRPWIRLIFAVCEVPNSKDIGVLQKAKEECQKEYDARIEAHLKNKEDLEKLKENLETIKQLVQKAEIQINALEKEIFDQEVELGYQQELLAARVRSYYKKSRQSSTFLVLFASSSASELLRDLSYRQAVADQDKKIIIDISQDLKKLNEGKNKLEDAKAWLAKTKSKLDHDISSLEIEVEKVESYFSEVKGKIAELSHRQQELLAEKTGTFQTTVGEVPLADDPASRPDFDPGFRPAFAIFSFGAPHHKGLSQYGAFGQAQAGKNYQDILRAYYGDVEIKKTPMPGEINTAAGRMAFEGKYLMGIAEMPTSWADKGGYEALKAQAVAARSYALAYVGWRANNQNAGGSICVTEDCQVYKNSKADNPGRWGDAVRETEGEILVSRQSGEVVNAWYASTAGGYIFSYSSLGHSTPGIWDTSCGNQGCWTNEAWEKKAGSPWFYKGWYRSRGGESCGRGHPWLNQGEMADILNAIIIYRSGQGVEHILPVDYNSCFGKSGEPWSAEQMKSEAENRGGAVANVFGLEVTYGTDGKTNRLVFRTNLGNLEVGGEEFYTVFNLRAPGRISLKSKLFNIEKKG